MSINIHITTSISKFPCRQTPTDDTYAIMESDDPVKAYRRWAKGKPFQVGRQHARDHVRQLDKWLSKMSKAGLEVKVWAS